jgi:hypothetical protein
MLTVNGKGEADWSGNTSLEVEHVSHFIQGGGFGNQTHKVIQDFA